MKEYNLQPKFDMAKSFYGKAVVTQVSDEEVYLTSYKSKVCSLIKTAPDNFKVVIYNVPNVFSKTTLRHIKEFLRQADLKAVSKSQLLEDYELKEV